MGCAKSLPVCRCDMGRPSSRSCSPRKAKRPRRRDPLKCKTKRPPGPYALFLQSMKSCYSGDLAAFSRLVAAYRCLRQQHPDWSSKRIRDAVMQSYRGKQCPC